MKIPYTALSAIFLLASLPLAWRLLNRTMPGDAIPVVRVATFNVAMNRAKPGDLLGELKSGCVQAQRIAEIVQRCDIDVLLLCELDRDDAAAAAELFRVNYLGKSQGGQKAIDFTFSYVPQVNTGEPSGLDLDGDGRSDGPGDAYGFGAFPGQYGMVILSRHPIVTEGVRTFRQLLWSAMPGALRPEGYYTDAAWAKLRLSSKTHCDVPIRVMGQQVHLLCSHPTPPVFDGPEDRNGCRNHDEVRFWLDYLTPGSDGWIVDDQGHKGGLAGDPASTHFVLLGDYNCDPVDGDARRDALQRLLAHPRVTDSKPRSAGAVAAATQQWGANSGQHGEAQFDTGDFEDAPGKGPGNLRIDYALPSRSLQLVDAGVFWPQPHEPTYPLVLASDHRLVWIDVGFAAPARH